MKRRNILWLVVSVIMIFALTLASACTCGTPAPTPIPTPSPTPKPTPTPTPTPPQTGVVEVRAMDAPPTGVSSIVVTTSNIEVHKAGAPEESWVSVIKEAKTFDLVTIQGAEVLLGQKELEAGQYTQIRLDVTNVKVVLEGKELIAKLPGEKLKVVSPWEIKPGQKTILTLDFDADKFVVITGKDEAQVKPILKLEVSQGERPLKKPTPKPDTTPPTVTSTINANGATGVPINAKVGAFFSEAMDPLTLTTNTFTLTSQSGTAPISGSVTYIGVAATFTPAATLVPSTLYTATITTGAKDLAGNALAFNYRWTFTTGLAPDITPPTVSSTIPANSGSGTTNSKITVVFSEAMDPLMLTTATFTLNRGETPVSGNVTYIGITATFKPTVDLQPASTYTATITTGAKDLAGNALVNNYRWSFSTPGGGGGGGGGGGTPADTTAPTVSSTIPANLATSVAINSAMSAIFIEALDPLTVTTVTFTLKQGATNITGTVGYAGVTATFTPSGNLTASTVYTATLTTGAKDLAGNALVSPYVWSFTTGAAPDTTPPIVNSTNPPNGATNVAINSVMTAIFNEALAPLTVTTATFTLKQGATNITGTVGYAGVTATFTPSGNLTASTVYTATITTGVKDLAGNSLAFDKVWTFTTTTSVVPLAVVPLGTAANFAILAKTGITTTGVTSIVGDIGVSPIDATAMTGFGLIMDLATNQFSTSSLVTGRVYAANYAVPTPTNMTTAISNMETAYTNAAGRTLPTATELGAGNIAGLTLTPGLYKWGTGVTIPTDVTLSGGPDDVWIFQISQTLSLGNGAHINLSPGVQAKNIFWQVFGDTTLGTTSVFNGNILCQTQIIMQNGATLNGRALAQTQVTMIANTVVKPAP